MKLTREDYVATAAIFLFGIGTSLFFPPISVLILIATGAIFLWVMVWVLADNRKPNAIENFIGQVGVVLIFAGIVALVSYTVQFLFGAFT